MVFEKNMNLKVRGISFFVCIMSCSLVGYLEYTFQLSQSAYWIYHIIFGFGFTYFVVSAFDSFKIASFFTLVWSFGNELVQDPLDRLEANPNVEYYVQWDHLGGDILGWLCALAAWLIVMRLSSKDITHALR